MRALPGGSSPSRSRPPARGASGGRLEARGAAQPVQQLEQGVDALRRGAQPSSSRARVLSRSGTPRPMSSQPGGVGWSRARQVALASARTTRVGTVTGRAPRRRPSSAASSTGSAATLYAPLRAGRGGGEPVGLPHVVRVHRLQRQARRQWQDRDQPRMHERRRQQRPDEQPPDLRRRLALEDQPWPQPTIRELALAARPAAAPPPPCGGSRRSRHAVAWATTRRRGGPSGRASRRRPRTRGRAPRRRLAPPPRTRAASRRR